MLEGWNKYEIPDEEECRVIMEDICRTPGETRSHCRKVAEVAQNIGRALIQAGQNLDLDLIRAAATLHDITKRSHNHDLAGGRLLREMGFGKTGDIVAQHTDIHEGASMEARVVFLADKLVKGEKRVTVEERYQAAKEYFGENMEAASKIEERFQRAQAVKQELEHILGFSVEK
jgi:HD superfamily phosphodiesterase